MGVLKQVRYLLYRNFLLKKRNKKQTAWEVISVLYFVAILATLRKFAIRPKTDPAISDSAIPKFAVYRNKLNMTVFPVVGFPPPSIGYVLPKGSSEVNGEQLIARLKPYIHTNFKKFQSEKELEDAHKSASNNFTVGLILNVNTAERTVDYTIKVPYNKVPDPSATKQTIGLGK